MAFQFNKNLIKTEFTLVNACLEHEKKTYSSQKSTNFTYCIIYDFSIV